MAQISAAQDTENYRIYTSSPNQYEIAFCYDLQAGAPYSGVRGALDKASVQHYDTGVWVIQLHDVFNTVPYPYNSSYPIVVSTYKQEFLNTQRIQHIQFSLSSSASDGSQAAPFGFYAYVWWWNPNEFPTEMADVSADIVNKIVVTIYDRATDDPVDPDDADGIRLNMVVTVLNQAEFARLIPKGVV